jgi:Arc/MetJ-type ribon-helix-helix transcriptional regulator
MQAWGGCKCLAATKEAGVAYQVPDDVEHLIKQRTALGAYSSEYDVQRDPFESLERPEQERSARWDKQNHLTIKQSSQGLSRPLDDQQVVARLRARLTKEGILESMARAQWTPVAKSHLDDNIFYIAFIDRRPDTGERLYHEI